MLRPLIVCTLVFGMAFSALAAPLVQFGPDEPDLQMKVQEALILAEPGTVFEFAPGAYDFTMQLSLDVDNVTIRGAGMYKTVWSFANQDMGSEGLYVTSDNVVIEDLGIEDAKGNCFKSNGANNLTLRRVRTEWTNGPSPDNGAYGLYPVSSENVLIDECVAIGASDAGIYVGQTKGVIVRNSRAHYNVAGIEIENCHDADVYGNIASHNTGGVLVFDMPNLPMQHGQRVRVFNNTVINNDTENFAPEGNIVGKVPTGTGVMVMANRNVEIFGNVIGGHQTTNVSIIAWHTTMNPNNDPHYYPWPEAVHIHNNRFGAGGWEPAAEIGQMAAMMTGTPMPDIVWDGIVNPEVAMNGALPPERNMSIHSNVKVGGGEVTFANVDAETAMRNPIEALVTRDLAPYREPLPRLEPVRLAFME